MDGFALSFRNGLYYERNGETELKVPYTFFDYKKFLVGEDDQIKHQDFECLAVLLYLIVQILDLLIMSQLYLDQDS